MVIRIKPAPKSCSPTAWDELIRACNARPQRVVVRSDLLAEVFECHRNKNRRPNTNSLNPTVQGPKYTVVDRMALFNFIQEHGEVCDD